MARTIYPSLSNVSARTESTTGSETKSKIVVFSKERLYDQTKEIVCYARCWERGRTFGAERFQKELYAQMAAAQRSATQQRLIALLGPASEEYLRRLSDTDRSLVRQVRELVDLIREYGPEAVAAALSKAHAAGAFGAEERNILIRV